eukprot:1092015-Amphidinium_carterae.1
MQSWGKQSRLAFPGVNHCSFAFASCLCGVWVKAQLARTEIDVGLSPTALAVRPLVLQRGKLGKTKCGTHLTKSSRGATEILALSSALDFPI